MNKVPRTMSTCISKGDCRRVSFIGQGVLDLCRRSLTGCSARGERGTSIVCQAVPRRLRGGGSRFGLSVMSGGTHCRGCVSTIDFVSRMVVKGRYVGIAGPRITLRLFTSEDGFGLCVNSAKLLIARVVGGQSDASRSLCGTLVVSGLKVGRKVVIRGVMTRVLETTKRRLCFRRCLCIPRKAAERGGCRVSFVVIGGGGVYPVRMGSSGCVSRGSFSCLLRGCRLGYRREFVVCAGSLGCRSKVVCVPVCVAVLLWSS